VGKIGEGDGGARGRKEGKIKTGMNKMSDGPKMKANRVKRQGERGGGGGRPQNDWVMHISSSGVGGRVHHKPLKRVFTGDTRACHWGARGVVDVKSLNRSKLRQLEKRARV